MKRTMRLIMVLLLSVMMVAVPNADSLITYALSEPFDRSELTVPEELQDGNSWYFIHQNMYTVSETSSDKLYIPIQRTGDLSQEGDVSLKLIDVSSKHDITYKEEMFRERPETDVDLADVSIMELVENADSQEEFEAPSEEELAEAIAEEGADFVDAEGNVIGEITATKLDENGNPVIEEETPAEEEVISEETAEPEEEVIEELPAEESTEVELENDPSSENAEWEEDELSGPAALRKARNDFTGTVSDRQEMEDGDGIAALGGMQTAEEATELVEDSMPGKIYNLHFEAGEDAKYLVITPLYDDSAEGDAQLMIMLKNPDDESQIAEDYRMSTVSFTDEDEHQPVEFAMASDTVIAEDGKAAITVTREGMKNTIAGIHLTSWGGNAVMGEDYGGIGADLYFPIGITSRTVELTVEQSEEQKDFYVTLTAEEGSDTEITQQTVHVVIPAAGKEAYIRSALTAGDDTIRLGEAYNLKDMGKDGRGDKFEFIDGGIGFKATTWNHKKTPAAGLRFMIPKSYFYDGFQAVYGMYLNYCDVELEIISGPTYNKMTIPNDNGGWNGPYTTNNYYKDTYGPVAGELQIWNVDNEGWGLYDEYARLEVYSVTPILRRFKVTVTDGVMLDGTKPAFAGMDAAGVKEQTAVILNDGTDDSCTIWGDETFSISQVAGQKYVRLAAIDAVKEDGTVYRIAAGDGTSQTLVGQLDEPTVNALGSAGFFTWVKGPGDDANSKQGNLTVRPVFEYYNAKVEIKGSQYGNLVTSVEASPTILWDFNSTKSVNGIMAGSSMQGMETEAKDDYYTFTATDSDPQVRIITGADDVSEIQWVKARLRTGSNVDAVELFGHTGEGPLSGEECTHIDVTGDGEWHTYIINIPEENVKTANAISDAGLTETAWQGKIDWIRLDPMWNEADSIGENDSIDIDYIAFFGTEEEAENFRETEGTRLVPGVYNFHIGDVLDLTTELSEAGEKAGLKGDGFRYNLYTQQNGEDIGRGTIAYANGEGAIKLRGASEDDSRTGMYYRLEPTFTETVNQVVVQVEEADLAYFDTEEGVLNTAEQWVDGTVHNFVVARDIRSNEVFELWAETLDSENIPLWTGSDNITCSGEAYYMMSGVFASDNIVRLSVDTDADAHAYYSLSGNVYAQIMNLATSRPSSEMVPAVEALVSSGFASAVTEKEGGFALPAKYLAGNTTVRYTVTYNGYVSIREAKLAPAGAKKQDAVCYDPSTGEPTAVEAVPVSLNTVAVDSWSVNSAHFGRVDVEQDGVLNGVINTVQMNGKKVVFTVHVEPGQPYTYNNQQYEEKVTEVQMYFQSQRTKEIHGNWSTGDEADETAEVRLAWDEETSTATLTIDSVSPEATDVYAPGDVLMLQLSTDKKVSLAAFSGHDMLYDPVSSGITMVSDLNFEPQTLDWDMSDMASFLQVTGPDESGSGSGSGYNFGRIPFMAEVNMGLKVLTDMVNYGSARSKYKKMSENIATNLMRTGSDISDVIDDDSYDGGAAGTIADDGAGGGNGAGAVAESKWGIGVTFFTKKTYWNGVRGIIAVVVSYKGGDAYKNTKNPLSDRDRAWDLIKSGRFKTPVVNEQNQSDDVAYYVPEDDDGSVIEEIYDEFDEEQFNDVTNTGAQDGGDGGLASKGQQVRSEFGGSRFTAGISLGVYLDFGYVVQNGEKSGTLVFMGGGGFAGFKGSAGYTFYSTFFGIPIYVAPEGNIDLEFYIGSLGDPNRTLAAFQENSTIGLADYELNIEFTGRLDAGVSFGVGIYKVLGARLTGIVGFNAGYGMNMAEWFTKTGTDLGYSTDFTAEGTLDLVITELNLVSLSFPLPWSAGWMETLDAITIARKTTAFVNRGIAKGLGSEEARAQAKIMCDELTALWNDRDNAEADTIKAKTDELRSYAYKNDILSTVFYVASLTKRTGGVIGDYWEEYAYDDGVIGLITGGTAGSIEESESETAVTLTTRDHVSAAWRHTADSAASLKGTYEPVSSQVLQSDAFSQTSSRIIALGGNQYLMVFLSDNQSRDRQMAAQLVYTVYDASNGTWTDPVPVQYDATADGKPHLADAGDKIILTWASIPDEKYTELKAEVAKELAAEGSESDDAAVIAALEDDPARVMALMEIYAVEFDKASMSFREIEQLTDDVFYDDNPQTVYDSETGDYVVLYYKTAQDDEKYTDSTEKLMDLAGIGANPDRTYAILCYMLYNSQTDAKDTKGRTHEPGWARDYLFPNETDQDEAGQEEFLEDWKGQRILPTAIEGMSDPPIGDLSVSEGYNGLAAFAFTVDKDYDLTTGEDKELYMQFYDFSRHSTYVPIKIAGERTENGRTAAVEVGQPRLIRNEGSTWLFWRENSTDLRYLNVSEMLNAKVATTAAPTENDWTYAVRSDGKFAVDAATGEQYSPQSSKVEFGSLVTDSEFNGTEYEVITDAEDNLYVVWSDTVTFTNADPVSGEPYTHIAQEIFATAMITGEDGSTNWSRPNRLTNDCSFNDGIALAIDGDGALMIVHNQYEKLYADTIGKMAELYESGRLVIKEGPDGKRYLTGSLLYNSPNSLVVTRCEPAGSVEATRFSYSHKFPVPGETIKVYSIIENTGITPADGCDISFYEYKDDKRGDLIASFESDEELPVNGVRSVTFLWDVPEEGIEGYRIQAEITEKKADGTAYAPVLNYSDPFVLKSGFDVAVNSAVQNGDVFDITFSVTNYGNRTAAEGTQADLWLSALYGDIKERYGLDSALLATEDISGLEPRETRVFTESLEIPLSVFEYCGYDAAEVTVTNAAGSIVTTSQQFEFGLEAPIHLSLNDGNDLTLNIDDEQQLTVGFETDAFVDVTEIVYSIDDTSVAAIDENGVVTALGKGIATITATLLPSGRTITMTLTVLGENGEVPEPTPTPSVEPEPTPTPTPEVKPADNKAPNTYDSYPVKYLWTGAGALLIAILAIFLRLKNRK